MTHLYTDGACSHNPGPGGWAFAVIQNDEVVHQDHGNATHTTNNKMELQAIFEGLTYLKEVQENHAQVVVCTDSSYCLNALESWCHGWKKNGWRKSGNKPLENVEIIQSLYALVYETGWKVSFQKVKAHQAPGSKHYDRFNDLVDQLAAKESKSIES